MCGARVVLRKTVSRTRRRFCTVRCSHAFTLARLKTRCRIFVRAGRCGACGDEVVPGRKLCALHLEYQRTYHRLQRGRRRRAHQCIQCGQPAADGAYCTAHAYRRMRDRK